MGYNVPQTHCFQGVVALINPYMCQRRDSIEDSARKREEYGGFCRNGEDEGIAHLHHFLYIFMGPDS